MATKTPINAKMAVRLYDKALLKRGLRKRRKTQKAFARPRKPSARNYAAVERHARKISASIKKHGASVVFTSCANDPDDRDINPIAIILNALVQAGDRNSFAGEMVYGHCIAILLNGLKAKARRRTLKGKAKDIKLLARFAYDLTKFVQQELPRKLVADVARHNGTFPVMMSLNKRDLEEEPESYLQDIECGVGLLWKAGKDSKWTSKGKQADATEIAQELIKEISFWLRKKTGRNVAFTDKNWPRYSTILNSHYLTRQFLDDPLLDYLAPAQAHNKNKASRRGRIKSLIQKRMQSMLK